MLKTTIASPWGPREPEPHFDHAIKVYQLALTPGLRSPFLPADELHPDPPRKQTRTKKADDKSKDAKPDGGRRQVRRQGKASRPEKGREEG